MSTTASTAAEHPATRAEAVELVAGHLLARVSLITRLLLRSGEPGLSRAEIAVLSGLEHGPLRVTELASAQALAQPTVTQLVASLERRGYVARGRDPKDGRVVLVSLADAGRTALDGFRTHYRTILREQLAERDDDDVLALAAATEVLQDLVDALRAGERR